MAFLLRNLLPASLLTSLIMGSSSALLLPAIAIPLTEATEKIAEAEAREILEIEAGEATEIEVIPAPTATAEEPTNARESAARESEEKDPAIAPVAFPKAGLTLIPPPDFELATLFDGFQQDTSQSSIMVISFPGPTEEMLKAFRDEEGLAQNQITLLSQENISISGQPGLLIQLEQEAHSLTFSKWILIFGEDNQTTVINASFPQDFTEALSAPIKASLLSAQVDDSLVASPPEEASDFSITPTQDMALALEISGTLLYSEDGELNSEDPAAPLFIVSPSFSDVLALNPGKFSRDRLQQTKQIDAIEILKEAPLTINDLEGYEITATAQDLKTGTPLLIYQTILFAEDRYYIMQGLVGETGGGPYLADFKTMAESFQRQ